MTSQTKTDPIDYILQSSISDVLIKGFTHIYEQRPQFPVQYLGKWLKQYSKGQKRLLQLQSSRPDKEQRLINFQESIKRQQATDLKISVAQNQEKAASQISFINKIEEAKFSSDLVQDYLPEIIGKNCQLKGHKLTGVYIGQLSYKFKRIEEHNFEPNAEYDTESPKIIYYVGASTTHQFMISQILSNESGRSYEVLKDQQEPPAEEQEGKPVKIKKKYLYVPFVQKDQKIFFFKFPKLGSFACFPMKIKSCLFNQAFDKGIGDYKAFVKSKEQIQKEYNEKYTQIKHAFDQAKRKYQEHQGPEDDPVFQTDHTNLQQQFKKHQILFDQIETNRPVIEPFKYQVKYIEHIVSVDTLGKDSEIPEEILNYIELKINYFKQKWEQKQYKMLLEDILLYLQDESTLQALDNYYKDQERVIVNSHESQIKEQFVNKEKQAQFQLSLIKCNKVMKILQESSFVSSMNTYLAYNLPKYKEVIQIVLMLLHYPKQEINLPRTNILNHRKCITRPYIEKMLAELETYQIKRQASASVDPEYKINKLLQRLQKIDSENVAKYNSWLSALLSIAKQICWSRIQCKNAKIEIYEAKIKAKTDKQAEIAKYEQQLSKVLEAVKAELNEETLPTFVEEQWVKTYYSQNIKPEALIVGDLAEFLDIE